MKLRCGKGQKGLSEKSLRTIRADPLFLARSLAKRGFERFFLILIHIETTQAFKNSV